MSSGGFKNMSPEERRELARKGGRNAHASGKANRFVEGSQAAKEAGRKGGSAPRKKREVGA